MYPKKQLVCNGGYAEVVGSSEIKPLYEHDMLYKQSWPPYELLKQFPNGPLSLHSKLMISKVFKAKGLLIKVFKASVQAPIHL